MARIMQATLSGQHTQLRFGWRDALTCVAGLPRIAPLRRPRLNFAALAGFSAQDPALMPSLQHFSTSDGAKIAFRSYDGGNERHIVLVHGSAGFGDQFHKFALALAQSGNASVHTLDMRGHGNNARGSARAPLYTQDIVEFVTSLRSIVGDAPIILGGHSAGGGLVLNIASGPDATQFDGWLFLAPFLGFANRSVRPFFGGWVAHIARTKIIAIAIANLIGMQRWNDRPVVTFDQEAFLHDPRYVREWSFDTVFGFGPGTTAQKSRAKISSDTPALLVAGEHDDCFRPEYYTAEFKKYAKNGQIRVFTKQSHWSILVNETVSNAVNQWLNSNFRRGGAKHKGNFDAQKYA